jgi:lysozyme family protein
MQDANFAAALDRTLSYEGVLSNNPLDPGGRTYRGVTQRAYDAWRKSKGLGSRMVDLITDREITDFYFEEYWQPAGCEQLPAELAMAVFDMAVNSGTWNAKLTLQEALRVKCDGVIGPATVNAAKAEPDAALLFLKKRATFVADIVARKPAQSAFLAGWMNRLIDQAWRRA